MESDWLYDALVLNPGFLVERQNRKPGFKTNDAPTPKLNTIPVTHHAFTVKDHCCW